MLVGETKARKLVIRKELLIFIDGPIADPPHYNNINYIEDVLRIKMSRNSNPDALRDQRTFFIKTKINEKSYNGFLVINIYLSIYFQHSDLKKYYGALYQISRHFIIKLTIYIKYESTYIPHFSKNIDSKYCVTYLLEEELEQANKICSDAVKATLDWQYPNNTYRCLWN